MAHRPPAPVVQFADGAQRLDSRPSSRPVAVIWQDSDLAPPHNRHPPKSFYNDVARRSITSPNRNGLLPGRYFRWVTHLDQDQGRYVADDGLPELVRARISYRISYLRDSLQRPLPLRNAAVSYAGRIVRAADAVPGCVAADSVLPRIVSRATLLMQAQRDYLIRRKT